MTLDSRSSCILKFHKGQAGAGSSFRAPGAEVMP
jgi:hypothetical protein